MQKEKKKIQKKYGIKFFCSRFSFWVWIFIAIAQAISAKIIFVQSTVPILLVNDELHCYTNRLSVTLLNWLESNEIYQTSEKIKIFLFLFFPEWNEKPKRISEEEISPLFQCLTLSKFWYSNSRHWVYIASWTKRIFLFFKCIFIARKEAYFCFA